MNIMNMTPTCAATAVPIPIATLPVFKHLFIIKEQRCCNCYEELFRINKNEENWIIQKRGDGNKNFLIPVTKLSENIINILIMLGLERKYYKVELIQDNEIIKTNISCGHAIEEDTSGNMATMEK